MLLSGPPMAYGSTDLVPEMLRAKTIGTLFDRPVEPVRVGRFVLHGVCGRGAGGVVYRAYDETLQRFVALKLTPSTQGLGEAKALAQLDHPNVVAVYEAVQTELGVGIAMQLVDGQSMRVWLQDAPVRAARLAVLLDAARGLAAIHARGLVHGDVKLDNILVARESGRTVARISDFGLAADVAQPTRGGSPGYLAPERLEGRPASHAADQYAFAMTCLAALLDYQPQTALDVNAARATGQAARALLAPSRAGLWSRGGLSAGLSSGLRNTLADCLADPSERPSASVVALALARECARPQRRRLALAASGLVLVASATTAWAVYRPDPVAVCRNAARHASPLLSADLVAAVRTVAARGPLGNEAAARIDAIFASRAVHDQRLRIESCEASPAVRRALTTCLDDVAATASEWATGAATLTERPATWVRQTLDATELARCEAEARGGVPLPTNAAQQTEIARLQGELRAVNRLASQGKHQAALDQATQLVAPAEAVGYDPLVTRIQLARAAAATNLRQNEAAEAATRAALLAADRSGDDVLAVRAQLRAAGAAIGRRDAPAAKSALELASARAAPLGSAKLSADLAVASARLALLEEDYHTAAQHANAALQGAVAIDPDGVDVIYALNLLARIKSLAFAPDAAAAADAAYQKSAAILGPSDEGTLTAQGEWAVQLSRQGKADAALQQMNQVIEVRRTLGAPLSLASALNERAMVFGNRDDFALAIVDLEEALRLAESAADAVDRVKNYLTNLGRLHSQNGAPERAVPLLRRAFAIAKDKGISASTVNVALQLGDALVAAGEAKEGLALLEATLQDVTQTPALGSMHGYALFKLGSAWLRTQQVVKGAAALAESLPLREAKALPASELADHQRMLAEGYLQLGERKKARANADAALARIAGLDDPQSQKLRAALEKVLASAAQ